MALVAAGLTVSWLVAVFVLGAFWKNRRPELHHFYYGVALLFVHVEWVQWLGLAIMADDTIQHQVQIWKPAFRSPLHLLARYTWYQVFSGP